MSRRERHRMTIMIGIKRQELTLVQADECIPLCHYFRPVLVPVAAPCRGKTLTQKRFGLEARVGIGHLSPRLQFKYS